MSDELIQAQLAKWAELKQQRQPNPAPNGYLQQQITKKLQILNELQALGHVRIESEPTDVNTAIKDLNDVLQAMRDCSR